VPVPCSLLRLWAGLLLLPLAAAAHAHKIPDGLSSEHAAPLLCAGLTGAIVL